MSTDEYVQNTRKYITCGHANVHGHTDMHAHRYAHTQTDTQTVANFGSNLLLHA